MASGLLGPPTTQVYDQSPNQVEMRPMSLLASSGLLCLLAHWPVLLLKTLIASTESATHSPTAHLTYLQLDQQPEGLSRSGTN